MKVKYYLVAKAKLLPQKMIKFIKNHKLSKTFQNFLKNKILKSKKKITLSYSDVSYKTKIIL